MTTDKTQSDFRFKVLENRIYRGGIIYIFRSFAWDYQSDRWNFDFDK